MVETNLQQPFPPDEAARLAALRSLEILDTTSEESFDELTALAASICQTPIALVSLIDEDRQWFKSRVGWTATATPRDVSFCARTILQRDLLIVADASADERFAKNPLVTSDPGIRFYAGAPLVTSEGHALGALCVIDRQPRQLTAEQARALRILSHQVVLLLQMRRHLVELARSSQERLQAEQALLQERYLLHALMDNLPDNIYFKDTGSRFVRINKALTAYFGLSDPAQAIGKTDFDFFTEEHAHPAYADEQEILRTGRPVVGKEEKEVWLDGHVRWVSTTKMPFRDKDGKIIGTFGVARDITKVKQDEELLEAQKRILELIVQGEQLVEILTALCRTMEALSHGEMLASILLLDTDGIHLRHGAAPSLPESYNQAVDGLAIGPAVGSCGTAAYRREPVYVSDIAHDPLWAPFAEFALSHGLRACWSSPIFSSANEVLGTFAMYYRQPRQPTARDLRIVDIVTRTVAIAIERSRAEQALRESEERFRGTFENAAVGIAHTDFQGRWLRFNQKFCDILGYAREELLPKSWQDITHADDVPASVAQLDPLLQGDVPSYSLEKRYVRKDGSLVWGNLAVSLQRNADGRPAYVIAVIQDISERKGAEEALRESERRFRTFVDHATDAFFLHDEHGRILDVNRQACESLGYTREELVGMVPFDIDPDFSPAHAEEFRHQLAGGVTIAFESRHRRKDGTVFPVEVRGQAFWEGGRRFMVSLVRDITERKRAEQALRESEHRWRSLTEALPQLVWTATSDGSCDYFSTQWTQHTGIPESELLGWCWLETLHPDDQEPTRRFWTDSVAGHGPYDVEYRVRRWDGVYRWFKTRGLPIRDSEGNIVKWLGTCTDITDLRQIEEALRASEERFRGTFENAAVGIAHTDAEGHFLRVNEKFCTIVGYRREELLQRTFQDITHPDDLASSIAPFTALMRGESPDFRLEKRYLRKDGSDVWVELFVSLQEDPAAEPTYAIAIMQDISERKRLEAELRQAKEAAEAANRAKDEFLANVSHEIRTPMNAILGMTELTLDTPLTDDQRQCLKTVKSAADSLLGIINDLLDFAKIEAGKLELDAADFSLRAAVGDTVRALAVRAHKKGLELVCQVQPDVPDALVGDAGRLRQVLLNLVGNAIKFTDAGEVVVSVEGEAPSAERQQPGTEPQPDTAPRSAVCTLRFMVRDTGIGIPRDKQKTIFRAFEQEDTSTTRKYGGTGLGLTIAARLVALMNGEIAVESAPGLGSTFTFTARFGRQPHPPEQVCARPPVVLHNLPVLVVDDNATNRRILEEWLRGWQMKPVAVGDGVAAMDALWHGTACGQPFALVLLDARMPDTDGLALAAYIRQRAPLSTTRIILLSSGDRPGDMTRPGQQRFDARLLKPVQQHELLETIYQVMSRTTPDKEASRQADKETDTASALVFLPPPLPVPLPASRPLNVLVAEDSEFSAQLLEQLLVRRGHRVQLADNGREALSLAENRAFDLLLLDIHMPELDGFQVVRAVRERERTAGGHLPVVALTARSRKEDREQCLAAGMDDFLTKPIQAPDLWTAIDRVVHRDEGGAMRDESRNEGGARRGEKGDSSLVPHPTLLTESLLDPQVLLAACGGDGAILQKLAESFVARLPDQLTAIENALQKQDTLHLREAAHRLCGMVAAFSTVAARVASELEDRAMEGQLEKARPLLERLEMMAQELTRLVGGLSLDNLREQARRIASSM